MPLLGWLIGAVDALKLITKGPGPPSRGVCDKGSSKSSMLRCQISPVNGEFIGVAINAFPRSLREVVRILAKRTERNRDQRRFAATNTSQRQFMSRTGRPDPSR